MNPRLAVLVLLGASLAAAGCISPSADVDAQSAPVAMGTLLAPATPMWNDPQNAPHPAYNYPTLTSVPTEGVPTTWTPITPRALPDHITGLEHLADTKDSVVQGAGIALFGSLAIVPGFGTPSHIVDISDPENPVVLGAMESEKSQHRGAIVIPYPNGRLVTAFSTGYGFDVWDITDPTEPVNLAQVEGPDGGHKIGVVPGTPIIYNAHSSGGGSSLFDPSGQTSQTATSKTDIWDLTNPEEPVMVKQFENGFGCHHIYFWNDASQDKFRAICAGIQYTQIWDTADPLNPSVIVNVPVHHGVAGTPSASIPIVAFSHFSILSKDGNVLIVGDEAGGGGLPPGCDARVDTPAKQVSGPVGNLWFYDVTDEKNPILQGWFSPTTVFPRMESCTAHHGRLVPDAEGRDMLAMAFYGAGVVLIDFTNPMDPRAVDQWNDQTNTWEVWYYNGYIFTGDLNRGLDVLTFS